MKFFFFYFSEIVSSPCLLSCIHVTNTIQKGLHWQRPKASAMVRSVGYFLRPREHVHRILTGQKPEDTHVREKDRLTRKQSARWSRSTVQMDGPTAQHNQTLG
jgi:hypothetical protein